MDNSLDKDNGLPVDGHLPAIDINTATPDSNRRRFTRHAVVGGAVLFSLGNRAAWGVTPGCMSVATLNSFNPATGAFAASVAPDRPGHDVGLATDIHRIGREPVYGKENGYVTCPDQSLADPTQGVCIEKGSCSKPKRGADLMQQLYLESEPLSGPAAESDYMQQGYIGSEPKKPGSDSMQQKYFE